MDQTHLQDATDIVSETSHTLDSWWQMSTGETKGEVAKISGAGDKNSQMEYGQSDKVGTGQKTVTFFSCSLTCDPT